MSSPAARPVATPAPVDLLPLSSACPSCGGVVPRGADAGCLRCGARVVERHALRRLTLLSGPPTLPTVMLAVPRRYACGRCGGELGAVLAHHVGAFRCAACELVFFERARALQLTGQTESAPAARTLAGPGLVCVMADRPAQRFRAVDLAPVALLAAVLVVIALLEVSPR